MSKRYIVEVDDSDPVKLQKLFGALDIVKIVIEYESLNTLSASADASSQKLLSCVDCRAYEQCSEEVQQLSIICRNKRSKLRASV